MVVGVLFLFVVLVVQIGFGVNRAVGRWPRGPFGEGDK